MQIASDFLKRVNAVTEDDATNEYYDISVQMMMAMNTPDVPPTLIGAWATLRLLLVLGEVINIEHDSLDQQFSEEESYRFSYEEGRFIADPRGTIEPSLIKFLRLLGRESPARIMAVKDAEAHGKHAYELLDLAYKYNRPQIKT
jgi:hypothetical protein